MKRHSHREAAKAAKQVGSKKVILFVFLRDLRGFAVKEVLL
jgi:hypothetical protein